MRLCSGLVGIAVGFPPEISLAAFPFIGEAQVTYFAQAGSEVPLIVTKDHDNNQYFLFLVLVLQMISKGQ